jgi:lipopolysaccharide biosynthesis regulator YciM
MLTELIAEREGQNAAEYFISNELKIKPTVKGVDRLIEYVISKCEGEIYDYFKTIKILTSKLIEVRAMYKCNNCGFDAKQMHWLCLGCNNWDTVKPVLEL